VADEVEGERHFGRRREGARRVLVLACGALAREILSLRDGPLGAFDVTCLPAKLHNYPQKIPEAVRGKIRANRAAYDEILCLYGDCGTGANSTGCWRKRASSASAGRIATLSTPATLNSRR